MRCLLSLLFSSLVVLWVSLVTAFAVPSTPKNANGHSIQDTRDLKESGKSPSLTFGEKQEGSVEFAIPRQGHGHDESYYFSFQVLEPFEEGFSCGHSQLLLNNRPLPRYWSGSGWNWAAEGQTEVRALELFSQQDHSLAVRSKSFCLWNVRPHSDLSRVVEATSFEVIQVDGIPASPTLGFTIFFDQVERQILDVQFTGEQGSKSGVTPLQGSLLPASQQLQETETEAEHPSDPGEPSSQSASKPPVTEKEAEKEETSPELSLEQEVARLDRLVTLHRELRKTVSYQRTLVHSLNWEQSTLFKEIEQCEKRNISCYVRSIFNRAKAGLRVLITHFRHSHPSDRFRDQTSSVDDSYMGLPEQPQPLLDEIESIIESKKYPASEIVAEIDDNNLDGGYDSDDSEETIKPSNATRTTVDDAKSTPITLQHPTNTGRAVPSSVKDAPTTDDIPYCYGSPPHSDFPSTPILVGCLATVCCFSGLSFLAARRCCPSPRARAERAATLEERRTRREYRRLARRQAWNEWWERRGTGWGSIFGARRTRRDDNRIRDYEEKRSLILQQEGVLEQQMQGEMARLMNETRPRPFSQTSNPYASSSHRMTHAPAMEAGRAPGPGGPRGSRPTTAGTPARSDLESLPEYRSRADSNGSSVGRPPSYHESDAEEATRLGLVSRIYPRYTPSATASTPSLISDETPESSVIEVSPRHSSETLRSEFSGV